MLFLYASWNTRSEELMGYCTRNRLEASQWYHSHYKAWWYANQLLKLLTMAKQHLCAIDLQCVCHNSCCLDDKIDRTNMAQFTVVHVYTHCELTVVVWGEWNVAWSSWPNQTCDKQKTKCIIVYTPLKKLCIVASKWPLPYSAIQVLWTTVHPSQI